MSVCVGHYYIMLYIIAIICSILFLIQFLESANNLFRVKFILRVSQKDFRTRNWLKKKVSGAVKVKTKSTKLIQSPYGAFLPS